MLNLISGKMTSKGQLTIPVELRNYLQIEEGDRLEFVLNNDGHIVSVQPIKKKSIKSVVGRIKVDRIVDVNEVRDEVYRENSEENLCKSALSDEE